MRSRLGRYSARDGSTGKIRSMHCCTDRSVSDRDAMWSDWRHEFSLMASWFLPSAEEISPGIDAVVGYFAQLATVIPEASKPSSMI